MFPHGVDDHGALDENVAYLGIHDEVDIPLSVAELGVGDGVMHHPVGLLDYGKYTEALAEEGELLGMDAQLSRLGEECETLDSHYVAYVKQLLPYGVVHRLVLSGADFIALDVYLDPAG